MPANAANVAILMAPNERNLFATFDARESCSHSRSKAKAIFNIRETFNYRICRPKMPKKRKNKQEINRSDRINRTIQTVIYSLVSFRVNSQANDSQTQNEKNLKNMNPSPHFLLFKAQCHECRANFRQIGTSSLLLILI